MGSIDFSSIVKQKVKERLAQIKWNEVVNSELDGLVNTQVDSSQSKWLESIRKFKEQLAAEIKRATEKNTNATASATVTTKSDILSGVGEEYHEHMKKLDVKVDLEKDEVKIQTQAKDESGKPMVSYTLKADGSVEKKLGTITNSTSASASATVSAITMDQESMTEEELLAQQKDVAFKIVVFFMGFIAVCFFMLYAYHAMTQKQLPQTQKQGFFDFLAGAIDDDYPQTSRYMR